MVGKMLQLIALGSVLAVLSSCGGGGLSVFDKKPETTPADLRVEQYESEDGKKTVITGTNDANAKEGMSAKIGNGGEVEIATGGSRKLEKWGDGDLATVRNWGWVFLLSGVVMLILRYNGIYLITASLSFSCVGVGLFNVFLAPVLLPILTGMMWNLLTIGFLINVAVPGTWADLKKQMKGAM